MSTARLALVCDLWAGALAAGMAPASALAAALAAEPNNVSGSAPADLRLSALNRVAALLALGVEPGRAWDDVADDPHLGPIAIAARRSAIAGAELSQMIREQAVALRRAESARAQRRAERAGVLITAPLTLCFLPAFICLGLAPVVLTLLGSLDITR